MDSHSFTYVVYDESSRDAIVIDPVLNGVEVEFLVAKDLNLKGILETHIHADHMTGSQQLKNAFPQAQLCIGKEITKVQSIFKERFGLQDLKTDGSQFDYLFEANEEKKFGTLTVKALSTPGHTLCCTSYLIGENLFTGDSLFMPDFGTGRCDFPGGDARVLFHSLTNVIYKLADHVVVYVGHDYCPNNRELAFQTTVRDSRENNKHINKNTTEEEFVSFRKERDKTLGPMKNLERNIGHNLNAGQ